MNFGGSFTQVNSWTTSANGTQFIPTVAFGVAAGDPIITGATNIFTAANFPGATTTDMQTNAPALYALLTGRVAAINRSVVLGEDSHTYGQYQPIVRNQQREFGLYVQDSFARQLAPDVQLRRALGSPESAGQSEWRLHASGLCGRVGRLGRRQSFLARRPDRIGAGIQPGSARNAGIRRRTCNFRRRSGWHG